MLYYYLINITKIYHGGTIGILIRSAPGNSDHFVI